MGKESLSTQGSALADRQAGQLTTAFLLLASCLLPIGLTLPALETTHFAFWSDQHSILSFSWALLRGEEYVLASFVLAFSVAFPTAKLAWMWKLQFSRNTRPDKARLHILEALGKWSMADVLVIALIVFSFKGNVLFGAEVMPGVFVFAAATILAMLASGRIIKQLGTRLMKFSSA